MVIHKMANRKFENVPVEEDTIIDSKEIVMVGEIEALFETWHWDGIKGSSLVFSKEDLPETGKLEIKKWLVKLGWIKASEDITVKESADQGFLFVNYNFKY
jgi:hypothetical protein